MKDVAYSVLTILSLLFEFYALKQARLYAVQLKYLTTDLLYLQQSVLAPQILSSDQQQMLTDQSPILSSDQQS